MRYPSVPSILYADRRNQFTRKMVRSSIAIFCSNDLMPRTADQYFPFRQDSGLLTMSGLDQPGTIIVLWPDSKQEKHREIAFILPPDPGHEIWHGKRYSKSEARTVSGIDTIYTRDHFEKILPGLIRQAKTIYTNLPGEDRLSADIQSWNERMTTQLAQQFPQHAFLNARDILRSLMMVKHKEEIKLIRKAVEVTGQAFENLLHRMRPGMMEYQVEAELTYVLTQHGCRHAFEPIVASGPSACTLHYVRNDRRIRKDELVLIDFGAEHANMAADMTRTIPASGVFTKRQKAVYTSVLHVLEKVTEIMRPGITIPELNKEAGKLIERELVNLKLVTMRDLKKQDPKAPLFRKYFMHGIGHHLGYDVHDLSERKAILRPGMVLTCEPGLYIREEDIGIRLENDILITRNAPKNLMEGIPLHPDEIEEAMHKPK